MLKAKESRASSRGMQEAKAEVTKVPLARFCCRLPETLNRKFEIELAKNGLKKQEWFINCVEQFVGEN
jgi:hypothetical protein